MHMKGNRMLVTCMGHSWQLMSAVQQTTQSTVNQLNFSFYHFLKCFDIAFSAFTLLVG